MEKNLLATLSNYKTEIEPIITSDLSDIAIVSNGIAKSRMCIHSFRTTLRSSKFRSRKAEVHFFKYTKPYVYGRLKFFVKLHKYLLLKPQGSIAKQRAHIDEAVLKLEAHNFKNIDFVGYYRRDEKNLDKYYFVRGKDEIGLASDSSHFYTDPEFSTSHDNLAAQIIAYDLLIEHYNEELDRLRKKELNLSIEPDSPAILNNLSWTASKTDLVEIIYALQASGAIRNGQAEINKMALVCEKLFDLELGNFYRTYFEIKERKNDRTRFLTKLKTDLEQKMKNDDEKY